MSRAPIWAIVGGSLLLVLGVFVAGVSNAAGMVVVILSVMLLAPAFFVVAWQSRKTHVQSHVYSPGAARREYFAEREAAARRHGRTEGTDDDKPAS